MMVKGTLLIPAMPSARDRVGHPREKQASERKENARKN
jgi:hypothetical protein